MNKKKSVDIKIGQNIDGQDKSVDIKRGQNIDEQDNISGYQHRAEY
jgi:hypothetical protein